MHWVLAFNVACFSLIRSLGPSGGEKWRGINILNGSSLVGSNNWIYPLVAQTIMVAVSMSGPFSQFDISCIGNANSPIKF